jgi:hypothetical protein
VWFPFRNDDNQLFDLEWMNQSGVVRSKKARIHIQICPSQLWFVAAVWILSKAIRIVSAARAPVLIRRLVWKNKYQPLSHTKILRGSESNSSQLNIEASEAVLLNHWNMSFSRDSNPLVKNVYLKLDFLLHDLLHILLNAT